MDVAIAERLRSFLREEGVRYHYHVLSHRERFTARDLGQVTHLPGGGLAKVVIVRDRLGEPLMVVLPAKERLNPEALAAASGRAGLRLVREGEELGGLFPDCEPGAIPPFGHLYGMPVLADACLHRAPRFFFASGSHRELMELPYAEYERIEMPLTGPCCLHRPPEVHRSDASLELRPRALAEDLAPQSPKG